MLLTAGANDFDLSASNDPFQPLLVRDDMCAVLVEPVPHVFETLERNIVARLHINATSGGEGSDGSGDEGGIGRRACKR